jgi:hypothetical protein
VNKVSPETVAVQGLVLNRVQGVLPEAVYCPKRRDLPGKVSTYISMVLAWPRTLLMKYSKEKS